MKFNDTTNLTGIIQEIERMTDLGSGYISGDATRLKEFTAIINRVNHRVWHTIFTSNGNWQYDDGGYTDLPQSTADLVLGQRKYTLPTEALTVQRIECKDASGQFYALTPIVKEDIGREGVDEFMDANSQPMYYRLINGIAEIFPAANYNSTGGFKVYYDRDSVDFATTDTTKTPGFASPYHEIIPVKASIEWLKVKQPNSPTLVLLAQDDVRLERSIKDYYSRRFKAYAPRIGRRRDSYK